MYLKRTAQPTAEPITLEAAMRHLRVDGFGESPPHEDEPLITGLITAAREMAEKFTGLTLAPSSWEVRYDVLCDDLPLLRPPVTALTAVEYVDLNGAVQTLDPVLYVADLDRSPPVIRRAYNATYPAARGEVGAVRVTYEAGPTDGTSPDEYPMPTPIYQAMLLTIGHLYEHREDSVVGTTAADLPKGAEYLMRPYRVAVL